MRYALPQPYREIEHTADVGVAVEGASAQEALARLVLAFSALLAGGAAVKADREERIAVTDGGPPGVALALLRELLFRFSTERVLPGACEVLRLDHAAAEVLVELASFDPDLHADGVDMKAVTRHQARFGRDADGHWRAQVLFDV